ncbi:MAG: RNA polymerase sigma factor [Patescibacteria group bacterium]|nr:RNA polymerase sigma factor [Patescibacteria group bacterium]
MSKSELVKRIKKGQSKAVKQWFNHYYPQLMRLALKKAQTAKDAEDLVQETFINCLRQIHLFRESSSLKTWMISILRHEIADYYRKKYAKKAIRTVPLAEFILEEKIEDSREVNKRVAEVLTKMREQRKNILLMKYVDNLGVREIARRVDRSFKAVESELYRAREDFKKLYMVASATEHPGFSRA